MNRPYQEKALSASKEDWLKGFTRQLFVMATGTGKTHTFAQLPRLFKDELPGQMLVLAHREELIDQAILKIQHENPGKRVDKEKAEHHAEPWLADVVVASVQSMTEKRCAKYNWTKVDKFVIDEAHHSTALSYTNVLMNAGMFGGTSNAHLDKRLLTGWTATPNRGDGEALASVYKRISYTYSIRDAVQDGWLVDIRGHRVKTTTDLNGVKVTAGDFNQKALADTVNTFPRNTQAYNAWKDRANGVQTIGFCVDIQHALDIAALFRARGVKAEAIWGDDPQRASKLEKFRNGQITVLFNCGILTEGFDMWQVICCLLCAPTKSSVKYTQMVGRTTRLEKLPQYMDYNLKELSPEELIQVKQFAIVIDMVDNSQRNSIVTLPTLLGLPSDMDLKGESVIGTAWKIEQAQREYPHLDLSKMPDVSKMESYIESINLFDIVFKPEVEANSEMAWHSSATGGYVILLPDQEMMKIEQNLLDKYIMSGTLNGKKYYGERDTLEAAFQATDGLIIKNRPDVVKVVKREQAWHDDEPSPKQMERLKQLYRGKQMPANLTKGKASRLISAAIAGKMK
jgi:ATP-dependent helicase IRC3